MGQISITIIKCLLITFIIEGTCLIIHYSIQLIKFITITEKQNVKNIEFVNIKTIFLIALFGIIFIIIYIYFVSTSPEIQKFNFDFVSMGGIDYLVIIITLLGYILPIFLIKRNNEILFFITENENTELEKLNTQLRTIVRNLEISDSNLFYEQIQSNAIEIINKSEINEYKYLFHLLNTIIDIDTRFEQNLYKAISEKIKKNSYHYDIHDYLRILRILRSQNLPISYFLPVVNLILNEISENSFKYENSILLELLDFYFAYMNHLFINGNISNEIKTEITTNVFNLFEKFPTSTESKILERFCDQFQRNADNFLQYIPEDKYIRESISNKMNGFVSNNLENSNKDLNIYKNLFYKISDEIRLGGSNG